MTAKTLTIGDSAQLTKTITGEDVDAFAALTMDVNPLHVDDDYAQGTIFGQRVAHGTYITGIVGAVLANELPGPGTIALEFSSRFHAPAFIGDTVTATVTVVDQPREVWYRLESIVTNGDGVTLVTGSALVLFAAA